MFAAIIGSPIGRLAIAGLAGAAIFFGVVLWAEHRGAAVMEVKQLEKTIELQKRIDNAGSNGPHTPSDVDKRLRDGKF